MIKSFIDKILGKDPAKKRSPATGSRAAKAPRIPVGKRVDVPQSEHGIDATLVDDRARRVVETCRTPATRPTSWAARCATCSWAMRPKDFDVATNATPEQVKACSAAPSSSAGASASCTWSTAAGATTR
jgi:poly(A) polymerase